MGQIRFFTLAFLFASILFNFFVFSPNNTGGVSPVLSISVLVLASYLAYWTFFTDQGKKYAREYPSSLQEKIIPKEREISTQKTNKILKGLGIILLIFVSIVVITTISNPPVPNKVKRTSLGSIRAYRKELGSDGCIYISNIHPSYLKENSLEKIKRDTITLENKNCVIFE